jgi:hypothetical protein
MARGILGLVGLAATLVLALPVALLGLEFLVGGDTVMGAGLLAVAGLMIAVEELLTTPGDIPSLVAKHTVGRVAKTDDEE